ncbi:hypothetical protein PPYR_01024 [Photinus pyralis]|uniref:C2HC/C3H-type domain-containing protein n=1 Tax=Photinus pyralis TaxID=7054 RepID=A0A1Y1LG80_PHOPY|nr:uncharacterized protein LOC116159208 [Photinus pyralis]KAB0804054.1 hypothetical protein PPYR_01024 [Photinus pyralis]
MKKKRRNLPPIKVYMSEINISPPISVRNEGNMVKKNSNLKLQIKPRPPKNKENKNDQEEQEDERPLTATLEKPQILDIKFINKIDMSLIRKEFLCITNLCRAPLTVIKLPNEGPLTDRPLSLPNCIVKKIVDVEPPRSKTSCEMNKKCKSHTAGPKKVQNLIVPIRNITKSPRSNGVTKKTENDASQKLMRIVRTNDYNKTMKLPQPCTTCGRPDQPERFHSHPVATSKSPPKPNENIKILTKSTVQKPVAIKYKSKQSESKVQKVEPVPRKKTGSERAKINSKPASGVKGPKTLMCYICGREFGTASLPLHEPRCLEKWQRENMTLPANQRMNLPKKPDIPMNSEQWNQRAWESCQASLVPCDSCGRTFLPDRLTVHQRSCNNSKTAVSENSFFCSLNEAFHFK